MNINIFNPKCLGCGSFLSNGNCPRGHDYVLSKCLGCGSFLSNVNCPRGHDNLLSECVEC